MKSKYRAVFDTLQNVTQNKKVTHEEISEILQKNGINTMANALRLRYMRDGYLNEKENEIIEKHFGFLTGNVDLLSFTPVDNDSCTCSEQAEIKYIECLPEEAKLPEITSIHVDLELVENHWHRKPENLRIIPMQGDSLVGYTYPIYNRDVLMIDINSNVPSREGIYAYSARNNTLFFVAKLSQSMDGTIKVEKFESNGEVNEFLVTPEAQKDLDFKILGRVVKNVSWTL